MPPNAEFSREQGPLLLKTLADERIIQDNIFAFYMESANSDNEIVSFIDIGEVIQEHQKPNTPVAWFDLEPHMYWMIKDV